MNKKLIIFTPFLTDFTPSNGSTIRIAGYTKGLNELGIDYTFFSSLKPDYVSDEKFIKCSINRKWLKFFVLHNLLFSSTWLRPFSYFLRFILLNIQGVKEVILITDERLIWTHQEYTLSLFLFFVKQRPFIYDIHGFFDIQREYRVNLNKWRKLWFDLFLIQERIVINVAPYLNIVSNRMKQYVNDNFSPQGIMLTAPDGIPDHLSVYESVVSNSRFRIDNSIAVTEKIILYAGSFKNIGGVTELVKVYCANKEINKQAVLLLIGSGQEENNIATFLEASDCSHRVFHIKSMPHKELIVYMKGADVIVCPDIYGNEYNEMTPHIKLYDAIASGKNVVASDFEVNREMFDDKEFNIYYFNYDKRDSFREKIILAMTNITDKSKSTKLESLTYSSRTKEYIKNFNI